MNKAAKNGRSFFGLPPWLMLGSCAVLALAVLVLAIHNTERERRHVIQNYLDRADALIWALEAGTRAWMGFESERTLLQPLLAETSKQPGIVYLAVINEEGRILAHSNPTLIGTYMPTEALPPGSPAKTANWRMAQYGDAYACEVYREFSPIMGGWRGQGMVHGRMLRSWHDSGTGHGSRAGHGAFSHNTPNSPDRQTDRETVNPTESDDSANSANIGQPDKTAARPMPDYGYHATAPAPAPILVQQDTDYFALVGFDHQPFEDALNSDLNNSLLSAALVVALGLGGLFSLFWAHSYRRSRRQLKDTQDRADAEVRRLQEEVRRNERLTALGNLAAGVAHEIRNPLSSIKGLATFLANRLPAGGPEEEAARTMTQEVNRLNRVVSELLDFARPSGFVLTEADLNEVVRRTLRLAEADIKAKEVSLEFQPDADLSSVCVSAERLSQALLNLVLNAVQAVAPGGRLEISLEGLPAEDAFRIAVRDNGPGMNQEVLASIFTPYFTTKPTGTGLGLAIVHQIAEGHGGRVEVSSEVGQGSVFSIIIPMKNCQ
ncbi:MAG: hypothetical protein LBV80_06390 [Deltaproteobacteria bacterium]|jgi:signal transduction histidine kinase|nr:hypothetical protein [Deltaproteobacteria bacterium]